MLSSVLTRPVAGILLLLSTAFFAATAPASVIPGKLIEPKRPPLPSFITRTPALVSFIGGDQDQRDERLSPTADNPSVSVSEVWDTLANAWRYQGKYEFSYNGSGNPTLTQYYAWNTGTNS